MPVPDAVQTANTGELGDQNGGSRVLIMKAGGYVL
jgi:hypothetical protein